MDTIGGRLREERKRLGKTQDELAATGGVGKRALINYEQNERSPDAAFLAALAASGADVLYILTGERSKPVAPQELLNTGDRVLLDNFHAAPEGVQAGIRQALGAFAPNPVKRGRAKGKAA